ncbi:MAG: GGDEF domain-containing protein [Peptostreptococcaceae bacterium]|nr:GGDEF domain-containing protein [Peptostreptococcaceae bacterium]
MIFTFFILLLIEYKNIEETVVSYILIASITIFTSICTLDKFKYFLSIMIFFIIDFYIYMRAIETINFIGNSDYSAINTIISLLFDFIVLMIAAIRLNVVFSNARFKEFSYRKKIEYENSIDPLTKLFNRKYIQYCVDFPQDKNSMCALMIIDVDDFKQVNDIFGHIYGDNMLIDISKILKDSFYEDACIGRLGGDEFIVYFENVKSREYIIKQLNYFISNFPITLSKNEQSITVSTSIGVVFSNKISDNLYNNLYKKADKAMYTVKNNEKNGYFIYNE